MRDLEIYIHIPFCVQKCAYCDFLSFPSDDKTRKAYVEALCAEIHSIAFYESGRANVDACSDAFQQNMHGDDKNLGKYDVVSIFIGGGTPSVLPAAYMQRILDTVRKHFHVLDSAEISIEMNPGTVSREKLLAYREMGINRISIGCQSMDDHELKSLGRIHNHHQFLESYEMAREVGFRNINIDLMFGLPGQTPEKWIRNLQTAVQMGPEHISAYSLIIEEGTPFYAKYEADELALPDEDAERKMYDDVRRILDAYGYHQYEISNFAKKGYECRHNLGYWTGVEYIGFGLGASSYMNGMRYRKTADMQKYLSILDDSQVDLREDIEVLTVEEKQSEYMILGLRLNQGVSTRTFQEKFGVSMYSIFGEAIEKHLRNGLLKRTDLEDTSMIAFTKEGFSLSNSVLVDMI